MTELEELLKETRVAYTTNYLFFPCRVGQPKVIYKDYAVQDKEEWGHQTLFVSCLDRTYETIVKNTYLGLTGIKKDIKDISNKDLGIIDNLMKENFYYIHQYREHKDL